MPSVRLRTRDGVDPRFVFKIRSSSGIGDEHILELRELEVLGQNAKSTYFVLAEDGGAAFRQALERYSQGEDVEGAAGELKSLYNKIDSIELYGVDDRSGPGIDSLPESGAVVLDITIWPSDDREEAELRLGLLELALQELDGRVITKSLSTRFTLARCDLPAEHVAELLELYVIESARTPPVPSIDPSDWLELDAQDLRAEWIPAATVGVLDDLPAANHPAFDGHVTVVQSPLELGRPWVTPSRHGSMVSGLVLNPDYARDLREGATVHLQGNVQAIRVLEPEPNGPSDATRFPPEAIPPVLIESSIRKLHSRGVRVFNLSFGYRDDFVADHIGEFSEMLDVLARELDIVVVVPTGNVSIPSNGEFATGHQVGRDYPSYVDRPEHRLTQPANAAIALTVGAIAVSDSASERNPPQVGRRAVAGVGHISPFSRTGPGHGTSEARLNKPDLVAAGGNVVVNDVGIVDLRDQGTGVLSTSVEAAGPMFYAGHGTSFASPTVAGDAAAVLQAYPGSSANLVRALVASSAQLPVGADHVSDEVTRHRRYGFGVVSRRDAVGSGPQRATMMFDGAIAVDTAVIHPVPVPTDFALPTSQSRRLRIALAYDPPVRRTRKEYTAATMALDAYRNVTLEDLQARLSAQDPNNRQPLYTGRRRLNSSYFRPPPKALKDATLQVQDWAPHKLDVDDGDTYFIVVTHSSRTWYRDRPDYPTQKYALTVTLVDESRIELDLIQSLTTAVTIPARVAQRVRT